MSDTLSLPLLRTNLILNPWLLLRAVYHKFHQQNFFASTLYLILVGRCMLNILYRRPRRDFFLRVLKREPLRLYNLRKENHLDLFHSNTNRFHNSVIPSSIVEHKKELLIIYA